MCGITGIFNFDRHDPVERAVLQAMNRQIVHRGPDSGGDYVKDNVGIAMRRLSIIDVAAGDQPLSNEDGTVWIVYNGEIYNHAELRPDLEKRGHRYRTHCDTETIVHLYEEYGPDCVLHLRGMFAFAIWDSNRKQLFCARDRLGIKPLYYARQERRLLFGSEIKTILEYPGMHAEFGCEGLPEFLAFGYLTGEDTMFRGVRKLLPGNTMIVREGGAVEIKQYWDLPQNAPDEGHSFDHYVKAYRDHLEFAVESHRMSDVPLGMLLSGGLDSSAVAALMQKHRRGESIQTFSVGYEELESSELPMAQKVAAHLGTDHHEVRISAGDFFGALPRLIWHEDEPLVWPSSVSLYFVCKLAASRVKVILTGEGSDETLAGYSRYAFTLWNKRFDGVYRSVVPGVVRHWIAQRSGDSALLSGAMKRRLQHTFIGRDGESIASFYLDNFYSAFSSAQQKKLLANGFGRDPYQGTMAWWDKSSGDFLNRMLYTDIKTYLLELLMKQDQMSMATSIESRVPFLDHVVVEFATSIPPRYKIHGLAGKHVLKKAVEDLLPQEVIYQRKRGFPTPWRTWLTTRWLDEVERQLTEPRSLERGFFRREAMQEIFAEHRRGSVDHSDRIWRLLNLELWHRSYIDADPAYRGSELTRVAVV